MTYKLKVNVKEKLLLILFISFFFIVCSPVICHAANNPYPTTQNVDGDSYYEVPCTWFVWQHV